MRSTGTRSWCGLAPQPFCFASGSLLLFQQAGVLLNRMHHVGTIPAKSLLVERFDERRQRQFPGLLVGVIELAEFFGIHAKLASHLNMSVRQAVAFAGGGTFLAGMGATKSLGSGAGVTGGAQ